MNKIIIKRIYYIGLTQEVLAKITALQIKHDTEIKCLAEECNFEPEFIKV